MLGRPMTEAQLTNALLDGMWFGKTTFDVFTHRRGCITVPFSYVLPCMPSLSEEAVLTAHALDG